jgi:hypothetical protein
MITEKTTISGTEEELLAHFKEKYNLIEATSNATPEPSSILETNVNLPEVNPPNPTIRPAVVGNKVTTGVSGLFDGTSWGNK